MDRILLADDDPEIISALRKAFENEGHGVISSESGPRAVSIARQEKPSLVFLGISMPPMKGLKVLEELKGVDSDMPVIVITCCGTMETAIKAMKLGAHEYLTKPIDVHRIMAIAKTALEIRHLKGELNQLRRAVYQPEDRYRLVGNSSAMHHLYKTIGTIAATPNSANVLLLGESGTGKELVSRAIHANGEYHQNPFMGLNCTVLPEALLASELFGHERGAFTGAVERKIGKFEAAGYGTIYLDEIGDTTLDFQKKLLRVLQEREFERLGGLSPIPLQARIIASTNQDLKYKIKAGEFREDLYFRLNVLEVTTPPLRERKEDVPLLVEHFLNKHVFPAGNRFKGICCQALNVLMKYDFPGNVRELENIIIRCVYLDKDGVIQENTIRQFLAIDGYSQNGDLPIISTNLYEARHHIIELFERKFIRKLLEESSGNVTVAAREAGIERQSFQRLMKKYDIDSSEFRRKARETLKEHHRQKFNPDATSTGAPATRRVT